MPIDRALSLILAIVEGHASPHWIVGIEGGVTRLTITCNPNAPPEVRAMLEQAKIATSLDLHDIDGGSAV